MLYVSQLENIKRWVGPLRKDTTHILCPLSPFRGILCLSWWNSWSFTDCLSVMWLSENVDSLPTATMSSSSYSFSTLYKLGTPEPGDRSVKWIKHSPTPCVPCKWHLLTYLLPSQVALTESEWSTWFWGRRSWSGLRLHRPSWVACGYGDNGNGPCHDSI